MPGTLVDDHRANLDIPIERGLLLEVKFAAADKMAGDAAIDQRTLAFYLVSKGRIGAFLNDETFTANFANDLAVVTQSAVTGTLNSSVERAVDMNVVAIYGEA